MSIYRWIKCAPLLLALLFPCAQAAGQINPPADGLGLDPSIAEEEDELPNHVPDGERLDLRRATLDQLLMLPGIDRADAMAILDHVKRNRDAGFESLAGIDRLSAEDLVVLRTFCRLAPRAAPPERQPRIIYRGRLRHDLQRRKGYDEPIFRVLDSSAANGSSDTIAAGPRYLGSPAAVLSSIDYTDQALSLHLLMTKDPGEPFLHDDTTSYSYAQFEKIPAVEPETVSRFGPFVGGGTLWTTGPFTIALGDFSVGSASGLLLAPRAQQRRPAVARTAERPLALDRSAGEASYLRGVALGFDSPSFHSFLFYSNRKRDARIDSIEVDGIPIPVARSLRDGAARRTHGDIRSSGTLGEKLFGGRFNWTGETAHAGITGYQVEYSHPIFPSRIELWRGSSGTFVSIDGGVTGEQFELTGEISRSASGGVGLTARGAARFDRTLLDLDIRFLPARFSTPHGESMSPFAAGEGLGTSLALRFAPLEELEIDLALSMRKPLGWSSFEEAARRKQTTEISARYSTAAGHGLRLLLRRGSSVGIGSTTRNELEQHILENEVDLAAGIDGEFAPRKSPSRVRCGLLFRSTSGGGEGGRIIYGDLSHELFPELVIAGRITLFQGDMPVYQFEQLLPGWPRSIALNGRGMRYWIKMTTQPLRSVRVAGFVAQSIYLDRKVVAEGTLEEIQGEIAGMGGLQVDLVFDL